MPAKKDEKVIKEIIKRYGPTLDLKSSPHLIVEIIRRYGGDLAGSVEKCLPPGGPPPKKFDPAQLLQELNTRLADANRLSGLLAKTMDAKPAKRATAKAGAKAAAKPAAKPKAKARKAAAK